MWVVFVISNNLETVFTCMQVADFAFVRRTKVAPTVGIWASHNELSSLGLFTIFTQPDLPATAVVNVLLLL